MLQFPSNFPATQLPTQPAAVESRTPFMESQNMSAMITVENLHKSYAGAPALRGVSFTVDPSELTVIIGPSGCGKSTLLRCLNGLEMFDSGKLNIADVT